MQAPLFFAPRRNDRAELAPDQSYQPAPLVNVCTRSSRLFAVM